MIIRKAVWIISLGLLVTVLSSCGAHQHQYTKATCDNPAFCSLCGETNGGALGHTSVIGVCSRCGTIGNEELLTEINSMFTEVMDVGTLLFSCLSDIIALNAIAQYNHFLEADKYTAIMVSVYEEIIEACTYTASTPRCSSRA